MYEILIFIAGLTIGVCPCIILARKLYSLNRAKGGHSSNDGKNYASELKHNADMWNAFSDAMPIHVYIKNAEADFRYVYSNKLRNDFFGKESEELIGKNDMALLNAEAAKKQLEIDADIMTKPQGIYEGFIETTDSNGKKVYFRIAQTQFTDANGSRLLLGAALNVTELEESRRELAETKKRIEEKERWLSRTLHSIGDAVVVTDKHGNTVLLNPVAERMLGVTTKDATGKPHDEIFHIVGTMDNEERESPVGRALRTGAIVELANHTDLISKTGERYHISDSAAPILDEKRNVLGAVLVFRDVTEAYQHRAALRDAVNDWEMASKVAGIVSFRINYATRKITGSKNLSDFWPIRDGKAVSPEEWVLAEDIGNGQELMAEVAKGTLRQTFYKYRVRKDGKIRHYRIFGAVDEENPNEIAGIIQDITEAYENEKRLQNTREMWNQLIDALPLNFFAKKVSENFRYSHCNLKFAEFVGKKQSEIIGKTDAEIFNNPQDSSHFEKQDQEIVSSNKAVNYTETVFGQSKRPIQLQTVKMPCIGPDGKPLLLGVSIDITELVSLSKSNEVIRKGLELLVEETDVNEGIEKAMKSVCEYIGVSRSYILHFDLDKKTVSCVREYCKLGKDNLLDNLHDAPYSTGMDWVSHFEKEPFFNIIDLQSKDTFKALGAYFSRIIENEDLHSLYCHRLIIDGKFWGYVGFAYEKEIRILTKSELDFVQSAAHFIELIIRHKRTQEALHNAVIKAHAAEEAKSKFLSAMSHEIRTPLNAVIGYSELLKDGTLPENEQKDYLSDISIAGNALLALINDILDLSKLEAGKMQLIKSTSNFSDLVNEVMSVFRQKFKEKHLENIVDIRDVPFLKIDPLRVRQILFNLIGNAVKFTDSGSIAISASFTPEGDGNFGTLSFSVKDTGCGISEDDAKKLFQPFVQSSITVGARNVYGGSGLGLVLVRKILDFMNGRITLKSELGRGAEFTVVIKNVECSNHVEMKPAKNELVDIAKIPPEDCRVLVVDDVPMNLKVMKAMLKRIGLDCTIVSNADEALSELEKQPFDVMLTDMWMPGMNGEELSDKIRRSGKYPKLAIVLVTADTDSNPIFDSNVIDAVLAKPVTVEKLGKTIEKFTKRKK